MLIKAILGFNQLGLPKARIVGRPIFNGLSPKKLGGGLPRTANAIRPRFPEKSRRVQPAA